MKQLKIKFHLNRYGAVMCRVSINSTDTKDFTTPVKVKPPLEWDKARQRLKPYTAPENQQLELISNALKHLANSLEMAQQAYTADALVEQYKNPPKPPTLGTVLNEYLALKQQQVGIRIGRPRFLHLRRYNALLQTWIEQTNLRALLCRDFGKHHADSFVAFCVGQGYKNATTNAIMVFLRGAMRYALEMGKTDRHVLLNYKRLPEPEPDKTCIDDAEYLAIKALQNLSPKLEKVRDMLIFMAGAGVHIGDYLELHQIAQTSIREGFTLMPFQRGKTKIKGTSVLREDAILLLERYGGRFENLPRMSAAKYNEYLKILGEKIGTDKNLTSKIVGRKRFSDSVLNKDLLSLEVLAVQLGLKDTKMIKHYAKLTEDGLVRHVQHAQQAKTTTEKQ